MVPDEDSALQSRYIQDLIETTVADGITLRSDTVEEILTPKRLELLDTIASEAPESVRDLARQVDRHPSIVSRDLDRLFEAGVIEFERDGRAKRPQLAHEAVFVEPIVFDGQVVSN